MNVLVLVGSLRAGSTNRQLAHAALAHLPSDVDATVFERLAELPHYVEELDHEDVLPGVAHDLREAVREGDALLVVTPEYNGSLPGALKNAVDWVSRPRGVAAIAGTPAAVLGASGSPRAAQWAREDAVRVLRVAGAHVLPDTVGVGSSAKAFEDGRLVDPRLDAQLRSLLGRLALEAESVRDAA